jgi:endonuclease/exonuclease/phosphatase (EEP) superfamily protein YafD
MWSPYYRKLVRDSGLRNARKGFGIIPTWPCGIPMMSIPLDHCLTSPSLQVNAIKRGKQVGSDHFPIIVDLAVTGVAAASKGVEYRIARRQAKLQE